MYKIIVKGTVQGVGFRPFIYRKAIEMDVVGTVRNIGYGVEIIADKEEFADIFKDAPPLAKIDDVIVEKIDDRRYNDFSIIKSKDSEGTTILPPDIFTCDNCMKELTDKKNRRYGYFFITCTDCGPRFSMIGGQPYDRPMTSMDDFKMCERCRKEYTDPLDRRFHAQTIACHDCGPRLHFHSGGLSIPGGIKEAVEMLKNGEPVAIKGIGGYHVACLTDKVPVQRLRQMLGRMHKPFAIMVKDIEMAESIVHMDEKEIEMLKSPRRPIVVLKKRSDILNDVSELDSIGVMLPYTALHQLLFRYIDEPLVMTSANMPGEPVAISREEFNKGKHFLSHDRKIINRCDDTVLKVIDGSPVFLRRSRGYVPSPIRLPIDCDGTIALGAEMNNTFCVCAGDNAFLSQHIGMTAHEKTINFFERSLEKMLHLVQIRPKKIACDLHPRYNTTRLGKRLAKIYNVGLCQVQHHRAHVFSVAAEHGLKDFTGIACDGLGYGEDGTIWGGEIFQNKIRIGHLEQQPMIGGDVATLEPKRMLFGILAGTDHSEKLKLWTSQEKMIFRKMHETGFNTMKTSSSGRVLDACAALLGICDRRTYEGRPAMLLESYCYDDIEKIMMLEPQKPVIHTQDKMKILDTTHLISYIASEMEKAKDIASFRKDAATVAHYYIADGMHAIADTGDRIVFSGGVACNRYITDLLIRKGVLINKEVPPGDGGIAFGQAYLANL